jgi:hypothetical protein
MRFQWTIFLPCILFIVMAGCSGSGGGENDLSPSMHRVQYEVSTSIADPKVSITYIDENGTTQELNNIDAYTHNWSYTFSAKSGTHLYLSSALHSVEDGTINSIIRVDYVEVQRTLNYMSGQSAIAEYTIPAD